MTSLFPNHPRLQSKHYRLREIRPDELIMELAFWGGKPVDSIEKAKESIAKCSAEFLAGRCYHWFAESKTDSKVVGSIGFYRGFEDGQGEVGYVMRAEYQGRGIMTELLRCALEFGYREKKLKRIVAVTHFQNAPSIALLKRAGFVYEKDREDGYRQFVRVSDTVSV